VAGNLWCGEAGVSECGRIGWGGIMLEGWGID
jgi:hypothetical protein